MMEVDTTPATRTTGPTKKRPSRTSKSPDNSGDDGKKRGRPRVDKQDESAADRRRTQIRMAQRAYRQRKESTLGELRKRVSELTNTIELMNKAFLDCRDRLAAHGLPETLMQGIQETAMQYDAMMRSARDPAEESSDPEGARSSAITTTATTATTAPRGSSSSAVTNLVAASEPKNVPAWMDESVVRSALQNRKESADVGMGYTMFMPEADDMSSALEYLSTNFNTASQALLPTNAASHAKIPHPNSLDAFQMEISDHASTSSTSSIPSALPLPVTYSFQESTFARRLHRACLEQGYQLLLDPQRRPATYDRVFKLSLMSRDRGKLITAIREMLDRGPHEDLHSGDCAQRIHVGGAGTHYPRRDPFGNLVSKKDASWNLGIVGPQTLALLENAARDNLTTDMTVDIAGFEGEWFDSYDVEGYLQEKGIFIDPSASFAEAEVLVWSPAGHSGQASSSSNNNSNSDAASTKSSTSTHATSTLTAGSGAPSSSSPRTPDNNNNNNSTNGLYPLSLDPHRGFDTEQLQELSRGDATPGEWNNFDLMNLSDIGFSDADTGSWMNFLQPGESTTRTQSSPPPLPRPWEGSRSTELLHEETSADERRVSMFQRPTNEALANGQTQLKKVIIIDVAKFVKVMTVSGVCIGRTPGFKRKDVDRALALSSFDAF